MVSGLIDPETRTWDVSILQDLFIATDVNRILKVPVTLHYKDSWYWPNETRGCYTVKEGYRRIMGEVEVQPGIYDKWLHLWKIRCPSKWKLFLWKALSNVLPTTTNLITKRVELDPTCSMCGLMHETTMHSLLMCDYAKFVWHETSLQLPIVVGDNFAAWFGDAVSKLTNDNLFIVIAVLYHLWRARNLAVWEKKLPRPSTVWKMAESAAIAWRRVHTPASSDQLVSQQSSQSVAANSHVNAHPSQFSGVAMHCQFDASFNPHSKAASVGAVLMTHDGGFLAAFASRLPACFSPLMAESLACKEALSWLKGRGLDSVHIFTDCSTLRSLLTSTHVDIYYYVGFSVEASKSIMSSFHSCSVHYIPRAANTRAHTLASTVFSQEDPLYWEAVPPNSIAHLF
ncbi:uncharacterized protein LOC115995871 [Ipomoea triloba]|uniref:uncharacterized protein LOC115995871 n=1 Tax=Ipomoea triloba TaxID=35885 RepID=UPI00125E69BF|nr:uncharacterized protein LOC115995871 [Ipomoea triloba]